MAAYTNVNGRERISAPCIEVKGSECRWLSHGQARAASCVVSAIE